MTTSFVEPVQFDFDYSSCVRVL